MIRTFVVSCVLILAGVIVTSCAAPPKSAAIPADRFDSAEQAPLGYLQHRERIYPLHQLLNPRYRQESEDDFVRRFNAARNYADWSAP
jgi:hypothetical protein